jgi:signal transduction histidine kinase
MAMDKKQLVIPLLISLLTAVIFYLDLATELGLAVSALYITIVLLASYLPLGRHVLAVAALCSGLIILGYFFSLPGDEPWKGMANRLISIYALWVTAIFSWYRKQSDRKREQIIVELESANRNLEGFSSAVSHDLRNPLIVIEGLSNRLLKNYAAQLDPRAQELLKAIIRNCKKANQLIHDFLTFSQASAKEIQKSPIDMEELARTVYAELKPAAGLRDIRFQCQELPAAAGDRAMMHQVFTNLIANAIKFTRTREIAVIEIGAVAGKDENVYFVKDNGVGFALESADRLFHFFQRLHNATQFEGTGLGLVIVKTIIEKHGGRVWAEGAPEQGAIFSFSLPREP